MGFLVVVFTILPSVAIGIRRLHDLNASGWWILTWDIPFFGFISMIVIGYQKSDIGNNEFGPDPYGN
jgi:uncharacterized membrane protein YhaH (DUF805 family)